MTARGAQRAAFILGLASIASVVFVSIGGRYEFVRMQGGGVIVAVAGGLLAVTAAWSGRRLGRGLTVLAGAVFLLAAVVLLVLLGVTGDGGFLAGNGSTVSLWLGLGAGLVALGVRRPAPGIA